MLNISEYLLSNKKKKTYNWPSRDIDAICRWLEENGVTDHYNYDGSWRVPDVGKLCYEIGPCKSDKVGTYWVTLHGNTGRDWQDVVMRTKTNSNFNDRDGMVEIDFETALELAKQMIDDPNKVIKL